MYISICISSGVQKKNKKARYISVFAPAHTNPYDCEKLLPLTAYYILKQNGRITYAHIYTFALCILFHHGWTFSFLIKSMKHFLEAGEINELSSWKCV